MGTFDLIDTDAGLRDLVDLLVGSDRYAIDTEFHREDTYFPRLALVQLTIGDSVVVVDPLAVDVTPLKVVFDGPGTAVIHASSQDLEVLRHVCGTVPSRMFDTQIAAAFVGLGTPSLATLYEQLFGIRIPKADQLSDWLARPLSRSQLSYAAGDVEHLVDAHDSLVTTLTSLGRLDWVAQECDEALARSGVGRDPREAWCKVKELRSLKGKAFAVGRAVAAWREERAAAVDRPIRRVLSDLAVAGLAQRQPSTVREMASIRGIDDRFTRSDAAQELLDVIRATRSAPTPIDERRVPPRNGRDVRPAASLVSALIAQKARDLGIDANYLGTRADVEAFLAGDLDSRINTGWRAELVGGLVARIADGDVAIAFTEQGDLVVEKRSRIPI